MLPVILSQMIVVAVGFIDNFMISKYNDIQDHLIAVGIGTEIFFGMEAFSFSIGVIFTIFYSQFHANTNKDNFKQLFKINIYFSILVTFIISLVMFFLSSQLTGLFFFFRGGGGEGGPSRRKLTTYPHRLKL